MEPLDEELEVEVGECEPEIELRGVELSEPLVPYALLVELFEMFSERVLFGK